MTTVADVRISHPDLLLGRTLEAVPDLWIRREYARGLADRDRLSFLAVAGPFDEFEGAIGADPTVDDPLTVADHGDYQVYRVRKTTSLSTFPARTADRGGYPIDVRTDGSRWAVRIEAPERSTLATYREYCEERAIEFELERVVTPSAGGLLARTPLAPPQREALVAAHELGYFAEPRETSLADVARHLDLSMGATSGRIRRGSRTLIEDHLRPQGPG